MADRSIDSTVIFAHPFRLPSIDRELPAGSYLVTTDEAEIPGLSFIAYTHIATLLHVPAIGVSGKRREIFTVGHDDISAALAADANKPLT